MSPRMRTLTGLKPVVLAALLTLAASVVTAQEQQPQTQERKGAGLGELLKGPNPLSNRPQEQQRPTPTTLEDRLKDAEEDMKALRVEAKVLVDRLPSASYAAEAQRSRTNNMQPVQLALLQAAQEAVIRGWVTSALSTEPKPDTSN